MSRGTYAKLHASQVIEDLLADSRNDNSQQNWLLSYLDVFILIIMLVITLLAITDFATPSHKKQTNEKIAKKQPKPLRNKTEPKSNAKKPLLKPSIDPNKKQETEAIYTHKPKSVSLQSIAKKIVTEEKKKSEIKTTQETAKTIQPKSNTPDSKKPESKELLAVAKNTVVAEPESPEIKAHQNKTVDKSSAIELTLQTEKQPIQESNKPTKVWEEQLKNKLEQFESVNVKIKEGYAQIEIQDNILFESAQALLSEDGKALLKKLTDLLKQSTGIIFIEGHTDNQPIATKQFPSNWELGSARATSVLHFLTSQDLNSQRLRAVTYAATMPVSDNNTEKGRKKNRRVNLLVKIPES